MDKLILAIESDQCHKHELIGEFIGVIERIKDGDTIVFNTYEELSCDKCNNKTYKYYKLDIRLLNVYAPEIKGKEKPQGLIIKNKLTDIIDNNFYIDSNNKKHNIFIIDIVGNDCFSRSLGTIYSVESSHNDSKHYIRKNNINELINFEISKLKI